MASFKRRRINSQSSSSASSSPPSKWTEIRGKILESISEHLESFNTLKSQTPQVPLLHFFPQENELGLSEIVPEVSEDSCCVGSSHGWLVFLDERVAPFLFNPFLQVHIQLPQIGSLLGVQDIVKDENCSGYRIAFNYQKNPFRYVKDLREKLIHKAVLSSDPCFKINNSGVIVIHGNEKQLAYCKIGDNSWNGFDGKHQPYEDIICRRNRICALGSDASAVEVWDFGGSDNRPVKRMEIDHMTFPEKSMKFWNEFGNLYTARLYLVESIGGDILLAVRFVGEFVNGFDEPVHEEDCLNEEDIRPLVCPYKTLLFHVYKLDLGQRSWVEVDSLGDESLFLGGNHSMAVSLDQSSSSNGYKKNSIYYTDDYWDRMDEDYLYGGHDMGVFSLENGCVESIAELQQDKILPSPCWVEPGPW